MVGTWRPVDQERQSRSASLSTGGSRGQALGAVPGATLIDAIVVASAASRGDIIYSSDVHDLERLRRVFPGVRILGA